MCGIYGEVDWGGSRLEGERIAALRDRLRHRGPDDEGLWIDGGVALAHRRLAVVDLSSDARQPMSSPDGRYRIVFNGEIYNFRDLASEVEGAGRALRTRSDTEVLLAMWELHGPDALERLHGMFAFAVWDGVERTLFLARDRLGKKPLFYWRAGSHVRFASELEPLIEASGRRLEPDRAALYHYLTLQSVPNPRTAFEGIRKLPPAHWAAVRGDVISVRRYWRLRFGPKLDVRGRRRTGEVVEELRDRLAVAVRRRLVSDVPIGALLSGGIDSGAVVAMMAAEIAPDTVSTFTVGFREATYDERPFARLVAERYATRHREAELRADAAGLVDRLIERFGEPFSDPAALPLFLISSEARRDVTVALCGDGGDESFAGYHRHRLVRLLGRLPSIPPALARWLDRVMPRRGLGRPGARPLWAARRLLEALTLSPASRNLRFFGHFDEDLKREILRPEFLESVAGEDTDELIGGLFAESGAEDPLDAVLYADVHSYLADTLLPKVDIASMACSLEIRSPFLDHELMEFSARLPVDLKLRRGRSKWILRRAVEPLLPRAVVERPKMGFGVPLDRWFRGEWREFVRGTLLSRRAAERGVLRPEAVERLILEHERGDRPRQYHLYNLLVLELWFRRFVDSPA